MTTAALYCRISQDDLGLEKGIQRQLEVARQLAAARGWDVVGEYADNDISAHDGSLRPDYQRLMRDAGAQRFERIIIWQSSRLWRNRAERSAAIDRLGKLRIGISACKGPELDLSTAQGRMMAGMLGEFDSAESEVKGERVASAALQRAQEGRANGAVLYGWQREYTHDASGRVLSFRDVENPEEAAIVREIVDRLLEGEGKRGLANDFNARSIPTPSRGEGVIWRHTTIHKLAIRPANVGLRVYKRAVLGPAEWPPIVAQDKHDRVVALLMAPERRQVRDGSRRHLLTYGIGACGICGGPLRFANKMSRSKVHPSYGMYTCDNAAHVSRVADKVDDLTGEVVIERLSRPDAAGLFDGDDQAAAEARERIETVKARMALAADKYGDGEITGDQLSRITAKLKPQLEAAEEDARRSRRLPVPDAAEGLMGDNAEAVWSALSIPQRRSIMTALGLTVAIMPKRKSGPGFDRSEINFVWSAL
jgi:DNA invertase Pin-like site-specific DNA recombinase